MPVELKVPAAGESISEVQIGEWLKQEGERVEKDQTVVEIDTDKTVLEVPAPVSGILKKIVKKEGEPAAVGDVIGFIEESAGAGAEARPLYSSDAAEHRLRYGPGSRRGQHQGEDGGEARVHRARRRHCGRSHCADRTSPAREGIGLNRAQDAGAAARLFLALWPDERVRAALATLVREFGAACGGRGVRPANLHVTLAFLGDVPVPRIASTIGALDGIRAEPFVLELDSCGYWRHNRIAWAGFASCPEPLSDLVDRLGQSLAGCGFPREDRPYVPHITLVRDARRSPGRRRIEPLAWPVTHFALMESMPDGRAVRYEVLGQWPLLDRSDS